MGTRIKSAAVMLLALILVLGCFSGCGDGGSEPVKKGRYLEEELVLPEGMGDVYDLARMADGSLWLVGATLVTDDQGEPTFRHGVWTSKDFGATWEAVDYPWLDALGDEYISSATILTPDNIYFYCEIYSDLDGEADDGTSDEASDDAESDTTGMKLIYHNTNDEAAAGDSGKDEDGAPESAEERESVMMWSDSDTIIRKLYHANRERMTEIDIPEELYPQSLWATPDGNLLSLSWEDIQIVSSQSGKSLHTIPILDMIRGGSIAMDGDTVAYSQAEGILRYSLTTGEPLETIAWAEGTAPFGQAYASTNNDQKLLTFQPGGDALFYVDSTGLYRAMADSALTERLIDGSLCSMSMPSTTLMQLVTDGDSRFLTLCTTDNNYRLLRYTYDPDIPAIPSKELRIYSLRDSSTLRQAIGSFQQKNPDVMATLETGVTADNGVTAADALRSLTTTLLSGNGPDILLLDGMPLDSYIQKGVLADLAPLLDKKIQDGELLENIANTYRRDGKLYAVPARFSVPMLQGLDNGAVTDLESLVQWMEQNDASGIAVGYTQLIDAFYPILSTHWFGADGALLEDALSSDLALIGRLAALIPVDEDQINRSENLGSVLPGMTGLALFLKAEGMRTGVGLLEDFTDLDANYAVMDEFGEPRLFPGDGMYYPGTILGVNAAGKQKKLAEEFVLYCLSKEVLVNQFYDGMPVNRLALQDNAANKDTEWGRGMGMTMTNEDGTYNQVFLEVYWMGQANVDRNLALLDSVKVAVPQNAVVQEIILTETAPFLTEGLTAAQTAGDVQTVADTQTAEDAQAAAVAQTVAAVKAKLDLYLAEQN